MKASTKGLSIQSKLLLLATLLLLNLAGCADSSKQQQANDQLTPEAGITVAADEAPEPAGTLETDAALMADTADTEDSVPQVVESGPDAVLADTVAEPDRATAETAISIAATKQAASRPETEVKEPKAAVEPMDEIRASPPKLAAAEPIAEPVVELPAESVPEQKTMTEPAARPEIPAVAAAAPATQAPVSAPPAAPLDLDSLENRLRKTKAIGLFTKLELKGQVEDLVEEVDRYHNSKGSLSLEQLEEHFDLLVMKLLILVQDGDPALSKEIATARPTLWTALADPVQFSSIKGT